MNIKISFSTTENFLKAESFSGVKIDSIRSKHSFFYEPNKYNIITESDYADNSITLKNVPDQLPENIIQELISVFTVGDVKVNFGGT